jgi:hypothetical protein
MGPRSSTEWAHYGLKLAWAISQMPNNGPIKGQERKKNGQLEPFLWATLASF